MNDNDKRSSDSPEAGWPEDEAPASEAERLAAERLRAALDGTGAQPADADEAELRAAAAMLRAAAHEEHLAPAARDRLVREAIAGATLAHARPASRLRRLAPALALAASVLLLLGSLLLVGRAPLRDRQRRPAPAPRELATSRPSNDLLGRPIEDRERASAARRLDLVFADRLAGFRRTRLLAAGGTP